MQPNECVQENSHSDPSVDKAPASLDSLLAGKKVLLVDDQEMVLRSLKRLFVQERFQVFSATTAEEASAAMTQQRFDLVVVDGDLGDGKVGPDSRSGQFILNSLAEVPFARFSAEDADRFRPELLGKGLIRKDLESGMDCLRQTIKRLLLEG